MTLLGHLLAAVVALSVLAVPSSARSLTEAQEHALLETVEAYNANMRAGDYSALVETLPPRLARYIEDEVGITTDTLGRMMAEEMERASASIELESFIMDLSSADRRSLPNGDPYVLIPTQIVIDGGDRGKVVARSHTLALLDGVTWYLLSVDDMQRLLLLRQVYPDFEGIEFPRGSMEALN